VNERVGSDRGGSAARKGARKKSGLDEGERVRPTEAKKNIEKGGRDRGSGGAVIEGLWKDGASRGSA